LSRYLKVLQSFDEPKEDVALRYHLAELPGIGLKTASWIVRNHLASNEVAVIDVHIVRACRLLGLFPENTDQQRHYKFLETLAVEMPASLLDAIMWQQMRLLGGRLRAGRGGNATRCS
jgi:endonuclease III